jgi:hypothetical protein
MNQALKVLGFGITLGITILGGWFYGVATDQDVGKMQEAAAEVVKIPKVIGDWEMQSEEELHEIPLSQLQLEGYIQRTYVNRTNGDAVSMILMVGPTGPLSVHTPDVCYKSQDMNITEEAQVRDLRSDDGEAPSTADRFWQITFEEKDLANDTLEVWYAWSTGKEWLAATNPRFTLSGTSFLYKIQVSGFPMPDSDGEDEEKAKDEPCRDFLRAFVPVFHDTVAGAPRAE